MDSQTLVKYKKLMEEKFILWPLAVPKTENQSFLKRLFVNQNNLAVN